MSDRNQYDYNHATSNTQFIALMILIVAICVCGLVLGLTLLTSIL
jgi:Tfp pilus assembly protein PilN